MPKRQPIVAGQFYPNISATAEAQIKEMLTERPLPEELPEHIVAGIVPHAGWSFSGSLAAMVFRAIQQQSKNVDTFVLFGAAHGYLGAEPAVYDQGCWESPLGEVAIDEALAGRMVQQDIAEADTGAHRGEHSIEVQIPFIKYLFPDAKIVPIVVPARQNAVELGSAVADIVAEENDKNIVSVASTDLTHYGPHYGYTPMGFSEKGVKWAKEVNDQQLIDLILKLDVHPIVPTAVENSSACGPGTVAAAAAAARKLGAKKPVLLAHATSSEIMQYKMGRSSSDSVGYAAIVM